MHSDRLMKLADKLMEVRGAGVTFDLHGWGRLNECGYSACAVGLAVHTRLFEKEGLCGVYFGPNMPVNTPVSQRVKDSYQQYTGYPWPSEIGDLHLGVLSGWEAVMALFDITMEEAFFLFDAGPYIDLGLAVDGRKGEINVADRIRGFVWAGGVFKPDHFES